MKKVNIFNLIPILMLTALCSLVVAQDDDGLGTFSYSWSRAETLDGSWTLSTSGSSPNYTLLDEDVGSYLKSELSYVDGQGFTESTSVTTDRTILGGVTDRTPDGTITGTDGEGHTSRHQKLCSNLPN